MARADTASASLRSDSIQGLAKSIAKPAYRRLLSAEPLLRRVASAPSLSRDVGDIVARTLAES